MGQEFPFEIECVRQALWELCFREMRGNEAQIWRKNVFVKGESESKVPKKEKNHNRRHVRSSVNGGEGDIGQSWGNREGRIILGPCRPARTWGQFEHSHFLFWEFGTGNSRMYFSLETSPGREGY